MYLLFETIPTGLRWAEELLFHLDNVSSTARASGAGLEGADLEHHRARKALLAHAAKPNTLSEQGDSLTQVNTPALQPKCYDSPLPVIDPDAVPNATPDVFTKGN